MKLEIDIPLMESQDILDIIDDIDEDIEDLEDDILDESTDFNIFEYLENDLSFIMDYYESNELSEEYIGAAWGKSNKADAIDGFTGGKAPNYRKRWRTRMKMLNKTKHVTNTEKQRMKERKARMRASKSQHRDYSERVHSNIKQGQKQY